MKNIKYIVAFSILLFLSFCFVATAQQGIQKNKLGTETYGNQGNSQGEPNVIAPSSAGNQEQVKTETQTRNQGDEQRIMVSTQTEYKAQNADGLKEAVQAKKSELEEQLPKGKNYETHKNQNTVRIAVHALLVSEELTGGIGPRVSEIAKEFNNSVQPTINAEEKIRTRSTLRKIFFGGEKNAAGELEQETIRNQNRIEELNQLMNQCDECSEEVKNILREQIQLMEQEQERLNNLVKNEKGKKGIFGFLFGWMF